MEQRVGHRDARLSSRGCFACIRMKIKCDEAKPHCRRCLAGRRQCPGYRVRGTTFVVQASNSKTFATSAPQPSSFLATNWLQNAVGHYFRHFVINSYNGLPGMREYIPQLYTLHPEKAFLRDAVQAISLANLARVNCMGHKHLQEAQQLYGRAIRHLRVALDHDAKRCSAASLAATEMLWEYDLIVGDDNSPIVSPHQQGMFQVLQQRLFRGASDTPSGTQIASINLVLQNMGQTKQLLAGSHTPSMLPIPSSTSFESPPRKLLDLLFEVASTCRSIPRVAESEEDRSRYDTELRFLDRELRNWEGTLPNDRKYIVQPKAYEPDQKMEFPQPFVVFPIVNLTLPWVGFWLSHLEVLQCLVRLQLTSSERSAVCLDLLLLVDRICSAIPYMTGQMPCANRDLPQATTKILISLFAMRLLYSVARVPEISVAKRQWMVSQLEFIGQNKGIGQALILRQELSKLSIY